MWQADRDKHTDRERKTEREKQTCRQPHRQREEDRKSEADRQTSIQTERRQKEREADREVSWCFMPSQPLWLYQGEADREAYKQREDRKTEAGR